MKRWYSISLSILSIFFLFMAGMHIAFWKIFDWENTLACTNEINRNAMYTLDIIVIMSFIAMAIITLFYKKDLLTTSIGKFILIWFSFFGFSRVQIELIIWKNMIDPSVILAGLLAGILYLLPVLKKELVWSEKPEG